MNVRLERGSTAEEHTKDLPTFTQSLAIFRVDYKDHSMAIFVVAMPDGTDPALSAQIPELQYSGRQCNLTSYTLVKIVLTYGTEHILFWPTVGAILSGDSPGVSLYRVLIFSNSV